LFFGGAVRRIPANPEEHQIALLHIPSVCRTAPLKNKRRRGRFVATYSTDADASRRAEPPPAQVALKLCRETGLALLYPLLAQSGLN